MFEAVRSIETMQLGIRTGNKARYSHTGVTDGALSTLRIRDLWWHRQLKCY